MTGFWRSDPAGLHMRVRLTPRSAHDRVDGPVARDDGSWMLGVRVRAAPEKGAANRALENLLAKWLGVAKSRVAVVSGSTTRIKGVEIAGDGEDLAKRLVALTDGAHAQQK